jgi:hypothetical protein
MEFDLVASTVVFAEQIGGQSIVVEGNDDIVRCGKGCVRGQNRCRYGFAFCVSLLESLPRGASV